MVREIAAQLRQTFGNFVEAFLLIAFQADSGLLRTQNRFGDDALLPVGHLRPLIRISQTAVSLVQRLALPGLQAHLYDLRNHRFMGVSQFVAIGHAQ